MSSIRSALDELKGQFDKYQKAVALLKWVIRDVPLISSAMRAAC